MWVFALLLILNTRTMRRHPVTLSCNHNWRRVVPDGFPLRKTDIFPMHIRLFHVDCRFGSPIDIFRSIARKNKTDCLYAKLYVCIYVFPPCLCLVVCMFVMYNVLSKMTLLTLYVQQVHERTTTDESYTWSYAGSLLQIRVIHLVLSGSLLQIRAIHLV